jgi:transposase
MALVPLIIRRGGDASSAFSGDRLATRAVGTGCRFERALRKYPRLKRIFADGGYAGPKLASALVGLPVELEIVKRTDKNGGFKVLRRRWVIERTFSWLRRNRRLMAHYEALAMSALGFTKLAMIAVMLKRLTRVAP